MHALQIYMVHMVRHNLQYKPKHAYSEVSSPLFNGVYSQISIQRKAAIQYSLTWEQAILDFSEDMYRIALSAYDSLAMQKPIQGKHRHLQSSAPDSSFN